MTLEQIESLCINNLDKQEMIRLAAIMINICSLDLEAWETFYKELDETDRQELLDRVSLKIKELEDNN